MVSLFSFPHGSDPYWKYFFTTVLLVEIVPTVGWTYEVCKHTNTVLREYVRDCGKSWALGYKKWCVDLLWPYTIPRNNHWRGHWFKWTSTVKLYFTITDYGISRSRFLYVTPQVHAIVEWIHQTRGNMHEIQYERTRHGDHTSTLLVTLCWSVNSRTINIEGHNSVNGRT